MSSPFERLQKIAEEKRKKNAEEKPKLEVVPLPAVPTIPTTPSPASSEKTVQVKELGNNSNPTTPTAPSPTTPTQKLEPVSPIKDFQKVSNSITREAIPSGIFGSGKAKQLYDALYYLTRGAIKPVRTVRITKPRLMKLAGIGTRQTLWLNLEHLESVGLVRKNVLLGEHGGNEYEVFTPEELPNILGTGTPTIPTTPTSPSNRVYQEQNLEGVPGSDSIPTAPGSQSVNTDISATPKTYFKDNTNDDEAFNLFIENFDKVSRELTGRGINNRDAERWGKLAELLILELHTAARHTQISSVPAFLTEHLRRKLLNVPFPAPKPSKTKPDKVGKSETGDYEFKPLDEKGREAALEQLREFANEDFLQDFKKWYTEEDWNWLTNKLNEESQQPSN